MSEINISLPKYTCSFANLWFRLFMWSNSLTYERLIFKYMIYTIYLCGLCSLILTIHLSDLEDDNFPLYLIITLFLIGVGGIGIASDCIENHNWSPYNSFCKCCKRKSRQGDSNSETVDPNNNVQKGKQTCDQV